MFLKTSASGVAIDNAIYFYLFRLLLMTYTPQAVKWHIYICITFYSFNKFDLRMSVFFHVIS